MAGFIVARLQKGKRMRDAAKIQPRVLKPGIYFNLDDATYRKDPALNYSAMKDLLESECLYWHHSALNPDWEPKSPSEEQELGTAVHTLLLEPDRFSEKYYVVPGQSFEKGKKSIRRGDYLAMVEMVNNFSVLSEALPIMNDGASEVVIVWEDPDTGILCKAKHDYFSPYWSMDYKSTDSISASFIQRSFSKFGYNIQNFHYVESRKCVREMLKQKQAGVYGADTPELKNMVLSFMDSQDDSFVFVVAMKKPPYAVRGVTLDEETMFRGAKDSKDAIKLYCNKLEEHGVAKWPAVEPVILEFNDRYGYSR